VGLAALEAEELATVRELNPPLKRFGQEQDLNPSLKPPPIQLEFIQK
jgi:hypothetical protein